MSFVSSLKGLGRSRAELVTASFQTTALHVANRTSASNLQIILTIVEVHYRMVAMVSFLGTGDVSVNDKPSTHPLVNHTYEYSRL